MSRKSYVVVTRQSVALRPVGVFERCPCGDWTTFKNLPLCKPCWRYSGAWQPGLAFYHDLSREDRVIRWWKRRHWRS